AGGEPGAAAGSCAEPRGHRDGARAAAGDARRDDAGPARQPTGPVDRHAPRPRHRGGAGHARDRRPGRSRIRRAVQADRTILRGRRGAAACAPVRLGGPAGLRARLPAGRRLAAPGPRDRDRRAARAGRRRSPGHRGGRGRDPGAGRGHLPPGRRRDRQGPGRLPHRPPARGPGAAAGHRGGPGHARLRPADPDHPGHDHRGRGCQVPGGGPVPAGQHGPQGRGGAALPRRGRRPRRDHLARAAGGHPQRPRAASRHAHRASRLADRSLAGRPRTERPRTEGRHTGRRGPEPRGTGRCHADGGGPVTVSQILAFPGAYRDSLLLLGATRAMQDSEEVSWASAAMATPAVVADLTGRGFPPGDLDGDDANALVLAVEADGDPAARQALDRGRALLFAETAAGGGSETGSRPDPRTVGEAARLLPAANVAVVSVPGSYAALAAHSALTAGLHVLLFSDNVSLADEVALKRRASGLGRLVMGPGAGTAVLGGTGLGFANAVGRGPVGVVAAAGTGAQEVMTLLDRWDIGVSQVIGVGGRDLSAGVGGLMARDAVRALDADPATEVILLVSKPPDESVAQAVIGASHGTPVVAACLGMTAADGRLAGAPLAATLEAGALKVARILGRTAPDLSGLPGPEAEQAIARVGEGRTAV